MFTPSSFFSLLLTRLSFVFSHQIFSLFSISWTTSILWSCLRNLRYYRIIPSPIYFRWHRNALLISLIETPYLLLPARCTELPDDVIFFALHHFSLCPRDQDEIVLSNSNNNKRKNWYYKNKTREIDIIIMSWKKGGNSHKRELMLIEKR